MLAIIFYSPLSFLVSPGGPLFSQWKIKGYKRMKNHLFYLLNNCAGPCEMVPIICDALQAFHLSFQEPSLQFSFHSFSLSVVFIYFNCVGLETFLQSKQKLFMAKYRQCIEHK